MAGGIVTPGNIDVVLAAILQGFVQRDRGSDEFFFDATQALKARFQLDVVVCFVFGNGGDDGNVVALGADVVGRRDHRDVDVWLLFELLAAGKTTLLLNGEWIYACGTGHTMLSSNLRLRNDQLQGVVRIRFINWVSQNANGLEQVAGNLDFSREVSWVTNDLLGFCCEGHAISRFSPFLHRGCDA